MAGGQLHWCGRKAYGDQRETKSTTTATIEHCGPVYVEHRADHC
jgi:hypothetical protein